MSEKPCGYRHLTDKQLEYQISKVSVKCLLHLIWNGHLTYRSDVYRSDGETPIASIKYSKFANMFQILSITGSIMFKYHRYRVSDIKYQI